MLVYFDSTGLDPVRPVVVHCGQACVTKINLGVHGRSGRVNVRNYGW